MALTLHVELDAWLAHIDAAWAARPGIVPVVKGNGYGFGRERLARLAFDLGADEVAVGTIYEVDAVPPGVRTVVLTPALASDVRPGCQAVLTVGSVGHVDQLVAAGWTGSVLVKLASTMNRFGARPEGPDGLADLLGAVTAAGFEVHGFGLHFPLASASAEHAQAIERWLGLLPGGATVQVSHVAPDDVNRLRTAHPRVRLRPRVGTALWHGDKSFLRIGADVVDRRRVEAGQRLGYRLVEVPGAGHVVMVSGGTAHGVQPLAPDGRSPFHFARNRVALVEPPHMHTAMLFVPEGHPLPDVGDELDLQRPLTQTWVDRTVEH